jgi:hypothetical protein
MVDVDRIPVQADVLGSDDQHIGKIYDIVDRNKLKLEQSDPNAQGQYHLIPLEWVASVEGATVRLARTGEEARRDWQSA